MSSRGPGRSGSSITSWNPPLGELVDVRRRGGQAQQALRRHHDERPRLLDERLAAEQVEVLRRRRDVGHADVALGGELQEALEAPARVLGARALVAVRQQQREARRLAPLGEAGDEELVDDHLRGVHEVAELRLPEHERLGRLRPSSRTRSRGRRSPTAGCCAARTAPSRASGSGSACTSRRSSCRAATGGAG